MNLPPLFQQSLDSLSQLYYEKYPTTDNDFDTFKKYAEENYNLSHQGEKHIASLIETTTKAYEQHTDKFVRVVMCNIPGSILPQNTFGNITDITVHGLNNRAIKRGDLKITDEAGDPSKDDYAYNLFPDLQKYIPRGLSICKIYSENEKFYDFCIFGAKKFTGASSQDDDDNINTRGKKYEIQNFERKDKIIVMEKINGEALHVGGRYIRDTFYYFVGSKKNHIMIRNEDDIELYTLDRLVHAKTFAKIFMKFLHTLSHDENQILKNLLHYTKCTVGCEILQPNYQHVVYISENEPTIVFLIFTSPFNNDNTLTAFPPHIACKVMQALGFITAPYKIQDNESEIINKTRRNENSEGVVMYYLNENNETICLLKVKTFWYTFLRALREKLVYYVAQKTPNNDTIKEKINKRFDEIFKSFAVGDPNILARFKEFANLFVDWFNKTHLGWCKANYVKSQFPIIYRQFLEQNKLDGC